MIRRLTGLSLLLATASVACAQTSASQEGGRRDPELEARVKELLPEIEKVADLSATRVPEVRVADAATLESYLIQRIDEAYPDGGLDKLTRAYEAFGLLPADLDLRSLMISLVLEQTLGYYDPARDVLFIREEVPDAAVEQVMVHELVHALQDQYVDLDSLLRGRKGNDARAAAQAAIEGHATLAMLMYELQQVTGGRVSAEQLTQILSEMALAAADAAGMEELFAAPRIVRETLLFPYFGGARYVQRIWKAEGGQFAPAPFGRWLPQSTEQVLHADRMLGEPDRPGSIEIAAPRDGWSVEYANDLGELEIRIYFEEHLGDRVTAIRAAAGWHADGYALLEKNGARALVWYTAWDSGTDAEEFVRAYRRAFEARFGSNDGDLQAENLSASVEQLMLAGIPSVRVVEIPAGASLGRIPGATLQPMLNQ